MNTFGIQASSNTRNSFGGRFEKGLPLSLVEVDDKFICYYCNEIGPVDKKFAHIETNKHKYYKPPVRMFVKANSDPELTLKQIRKALDLPESSNAYVKIMLKESLPVLDGEYIENDIIYFYAQLIDANEAMHFYIKSEGDKTFPFTVSRG